MNILIDFVATSILNRSEGLKFNYEVRKYDLNHERTVFDLIIGRR